MPKSKYKKEKHWTLNEDGRAIQPEGITNDTNPYGGYTGIAVYPNYMMAPPPLSAESDDVLGDTNAWNDSVKMVATSGFAIDQTKYVDFATAYANIEEKYYAPTMTGTISLEEVLPDIIEELEGIGFYEVLAECQAELDAYLAQK